MKKSNYPFRLRTAAALTVLAVLPGTLSACGRRGGEETGTVSGTTPAGGFTEGIQTIITPGTSPEAVTMFVPEAASEPETGRYDKTGLTASVTLTGNGASAEGSGVSVSGGTVTFTAAGTYLVTGTLTGQLVINTQDAEKVKLVLNGVSVYNPDGPAVYVVSAPKKAILYTAEDSVNLLSDGSGYIVPDEQQTEGGIYPNACIYARADLKLDGLGTLQVTGNAEKGINTSDDLEIAGGTLTVTAAGVGIRGNDSVDVTGGVVTVVSGGDGIKTAQTEKEGKGVLTVSGGTLSVTATGDGLSAATDLTFAGGTAVIVTRDVSGSTAGGNQQTVQPGTQPGGLGGFPGGRGPGGGGFGGEGNRNKPSISTKGLKAAGTVTVSGGSLTLTTADDGIHADDTVLIRDGSIRIEAGDDGIHADKTLTISGGVTEIVKSYEGLEADKINLLGGTNRITASDDGTNASNGESGGGMGFPGGTRPGGRGGQTGGAQDANAPLLTIAGGYTVINAAGDGIDSNGNIVMTGGTLLVYGPTDNGNGPIDHGDGSYTMTISGGTLLAVGSSGMADTPENAGQAAWACKMGSIPGGTLVGLADADGTLVCGFRVPKTIASVVFSSPALTAGSAYTLVTGGDAQADADGVIDLTSWSGYSSVGTLNAY